MHAELLYTSAPQGLKQGSRGFCTVLCTQGMPANMAQRLEALSMYRHVFAPGDPNASRNPVCYAHLRFTLGPKQTNLLTRISDYGLDYSQRTNKLAHHIVVAAPLPDCGPAALLAYPGMMKQSWDGKCDTPALGPQLPALQSDPKPCRTWATVTGDAGWGGVIANAWLKPGGKTLWLIFSESQSAQLLEMFEESISLLPPASRWQATFSTYFTNLPPDVQCKVRCVLAGSEEAKHANARGDVIDLTRSLGKAPAGLGAEEARNGILIGTAGTSASPPSPFPKYPGSSVSADALDTSEVSSRLRRSQSAQANRPSATAPPLRPNVDEIPRIKGQGHTHLDGRLPPATTDPNREISTRSRSVSVGLLLAAGVLFLILLPMLGAGAVLIAFNLFPNTASQSPLPGEGVEATKTEPAPTDTNNTSNTPDDPTAEQQKSGETVAPMPKPETDTDSSAQKSMPETKSDKPPAITADNFNIVTKFNHPAFGDLSDRKWLVDGTELTIEIAPKGNIDQQRRKEEMWLEEHPPAISLQLHGKAKDVVSQRCNFEYADVAEILNADVAAASKRGDIKVVLEGTVEIDERKFPIKHELQVPHLRVVLQEKHVLYLLEPEFFDRGSFGEDVLYQMDKSAEWIGKLNKLQPKKQWYAYKDTNTLKPSMRVFDHDELSDNAKLRKLLFPEYESGLATEINTFRDKATRPFRDMLDMIRKKAVSKKDDEKSAFPAIKLLDELLEEQARVVADYMKGKVETADGQPWKKARDIASKLEQDLAAKDWASYYPTQDERKSLDVTLVAAEWNNDKSSLKNSWNRVMEHSNAILDLLQTPKKLVYDLRIQELNNNDTSLKLPVIVDYQP